MPSIETKHFGILDYEEQSVIEFPSGLPAFEDERRFVLLQQPATEPLVFLQSLQPNQLSFIALPVQLIAPDYHLQAEAEDLDALALPSDYQPDMGPHTACLAILTVSDGAPATANLLAPIVINLKTRQARQIIQIGAGYSHRHPLPAPEKENPCS